jgi:hypothetical protein
MIAVSSLGKIRKVMVEYPQGWLSTLTEKMETTSCLENRPKKSGISGCMGALELMLLNLQNTFLKKIVCVPILTVG